MGASGGTLTGPAAVAWPSASSSVRAERVARSIVLVVLYAAPALVCLHWAAVGEGDIWWHLRAGEWIAQHLAVPHTDPFSQYGMGRPWAAYSWLYELVLLLLYRMWGLVGVVGYTTGMVLAVTVAVHRLIARLQGDFTQAVLLTMAVMLCMSRLDSPRPWMFTVLLFAVELDVLLTARRTGRVRGLLWLPAMFALWANVHIQFVDGLVVLGLAAAEATVAATGWGTISGKETRLRARFLWLLLGGCALAVMVNPYGWGIYRVAWELASQKGVMGYITELQAIPFRGFPDFLLLFLALGAAGALGWGRRLPFFETALLGLAAVVSFRSQRDVWLMAVVAGAVLAVRLPGAVKEGEERLREVSPLLVWGAACVAVLVGGFAMQVKEARLRTSLAAEMPVGAVAAIEAQGLRGRLYNPYEWGGYLMWTLREPVSMDGRAALQGDERLERANKTWRAEPDWAADPELMASGVVVAPVKMPLTQVLRLDGRWRLAFEDGVAAVFARR